MTNKKQTATKLQSGRGLALAIFVLIPIWMSLQLQIFRPLPTPSPRIPSPRIPSHSNSRLLPFRYWNHRSMYPERYTDNSCMMFPAISELQYAGSSWQLLKVDNGNVYVYGAYFDDRFEETMVRVLIYTDVHPVPKLFCQLWFPGDNEPQTELAEAMYAWHPGWGGHFKGVNEPYILSCRSRRKEIAPIAAAVVTTPCGVATNVMNVQNAPFDDRLNYKKRVPSRRNSTSVAVCLKWLNYRDDVSGKVINWMQLVKRLGAEKVYMYVIKLHPNTRKVLKYYEDEGFAVVTELSHPPTVSGLKLGRLSRVLRDSRTELLPLNDCLYRSIGHHDWLAAIDLDEITAPASGDTWVDLIDNETAVAAVEPGGLPFDALALQDLEAPANTRILSRNWRNSHSPYDSGKKTFFNVSSVTAMHNHYPLYCKGGCRNRAMGKGSSKMLYFWESNEDKQDSEVVDGDIMFRGWRAPVLREIKDVWGKLGL